MMNHVVRNVSYVYNVVIDNGNNRDSVTGLSNLAGLPLNEILND